MLSEEHAATIARDWNVPHSGAGYVIKFPALNASIVGAIEVTAEYH